MTLTQEMQKKKEVLDARLLGLGSVLVACSGGIDSAYLAWAAHQVLGERMLAVIADSPSLSRSHLKDALLFAEENCIPLKTVNTSEMEHEAYAVNGADRCFHCKDELFTVLEREREQMGFGAVAYGLNTDDKGDFRPGQKAAIAHRVAGAAGGGRAGQGGDPRAGAGCRAAGLGQAGLGMPLVPD